MFSTTPFRAPATVVDLALILLVAGCGPDAAPSTETQAAQAAEAQPSESGDELVPIPRPEGERAIGARLREYQIEVTRDTVPAGEVEFHVVNGGTTTHWLIVRDDTLFSGTPHLLPGETAVMRVELSPGEYQLVCTIRDEFDHITEGMKRSLTVL
ncbi:MAG: hypothetical protein WD737_08360 [Gemmatimonadota bacterium]